MPQQVTCPWCTWCSHVSGKHARQEYSTRAATRPHADMQHWHPGAPTICSRTSHASVSMVLSCTRRDSSSASSGQEATTASRSERERLQGQRRSTEALVSKRLQAGRHPKDSVRVGRGHASERGMTWACAAGTACCHRPSTRQTVKAAFQLRTCTARSSWWLPLWRYAARPACSCTRQSTAQLTAPQPP
jgi:hypothetical protein